jgi:hypothetical protein
MEVSLQSHKLKRILLTAVSHYRQKSFNLIFQIFRLSFTEIVILGL